MGKSRLHIVEFVCMLLLFGAYLMGSQEEVKYQLSVDDPLSATVLTKTPSFPPHHKHVTFSHTPHGKSHRSGAKHFTFEVILPVKKTIDKPIVYLAPSSYPNISEDYTYLYYQEINPPPPKQAC